MGAAFRPVLVCRLCSSGDLHPYIDFGNVPLGNNLQASVEAARAAHSYPLKLMRCGSCGHFQLSVAVNPTLLYATNYTYLSGIGASFVKHFATYADWVVARCGLPDGATVVDVGSNDGTCLKALQRKGFKVCGVDPASLAASIANANGVETINAFFDADVVAEIKRRHGAVDFVTSHNVLAHVEDLAATFRDIYAVLKDGGYFCFEVGYFRDVLKSGNFDTIYHEHIDYHHATPLVRHLAELGFVTVDLSVNAIQGGSLRLLVRKSASEVMPDSVQAFLDEEKRSILYDQAFLANWSREIEKKMSGFRQMVRGHLEAGRSVVGYGAPTKATLLLKMASLSEDDITCVVEDNPHKVGLFLPSSGIPVLASADLTKMSFDVLVLLAWNFADDITAKLAGKLSRPIDVIVPLPEPKTVTLK